MTTRVRGIATSVLVVIATVAILVSTLAVWSRRTVLDNGRFTSEVHDVLSDSRVSDALARYLTEQVMLVVNPEQVAQDLLPDRATALAGPLAASIEQFVLTRAQNVVASDAFINSFTQLAGRAHNAAIRLLEGEDVAGLEVQGDSVVLDLVPVIADVLRDVGADGLVDRLAQLPAFGGDQPPSAHVQEIIDRTGVQVPENFGQITVFETSAITQAQDALQLFKRLVVLMVVVTLLLVAAAILLSPNRRRTLVQLGIGVAIAMVLAWILSRWAQERVIDRVSAPRADGIDVGAATDAVLTGFLDRLRGAIVLLAILGLVTAVIAFIFGPSATAGRVRGRAASVLHEARPGGSVADFAVAHRDGLRIAVGALGLVLLLWLGLDLATLLIVAVVVIAGLVIIERLARKPVAAPTPS